VSGRVSRPALRAIHEFRARLTRYKLQERAVLDPRQVEGAAPDLAADGAVGGFDRQAGAARFAAVAGISEASRGGAPP